MARATQCGGGSRRRQSGASAVEFALVFPILFLLTYGAIVYSYVFVLRQSINFAAQEAAEAAVDVDPAQLPATYEALVVTSAQATARAVVAWMPARVRDGITTPVLFCPEAGSPLCPTDASGAVVVTINLSLTGPFSLFARFNLPIVGLFPPLPDTMTAQAVARV